MAVLAPRPLRQTVPTMRLLPALVALALIAAPGRALAGPAAAGTPHAGAAAPAAAPAPGTSPAAPTPRSLPSAETPAGAAPVIVRLPAPAGSSSGASTLIAIEALLREQQRQLQALTDRLAPCEATLRALERHDTRQPSLDNILGAVTALGTRLDTLESAVRELHTQAAQRQRKTQQDEVAAPAPDPARVERSLTERRSDSPVTTRDPFESPRTAPSGPTRLDTVAIYIVHIVQPGDTVSALAARFSVQPQRLIKLNRLEDPNRLLPGQRLRIPQGAQSAEAP